MQLLFRHYQFGISLESIYLVSITYKIELFVSIYLSMYECPLIVARAIQNFESEVKIKKLIVAFSNKQIKT